MLSILTLLITDAIITSMAELVMESCLKGALTPDLEEEMMLAMVLARRIETMINHLRLTSAYCKDHFH